jgi:hypothetical protein
MSMDDYLLELTKQKSSLKKIAEETREELVETKTVRSMDDLKDVFPELAKGKNTKIWYTKDDALLPNGEKVGREFRMGHEWLEEKGIAMPTTKTISKTHSLVGTIDTRGKSQFESVYTVLNMWGNKHDIRPLIRSLDKVHHTSMSVGDIIEYQNKLFMVDNFGFKEI